MQVCSWESAFLPSLAQFCRCARIMLNCLRNAAKTQELAFQGSALASVYGRYTASDCSDGRLTLAPTLGKGVKSINSQGLSGVFIRRVTILKISHIYVLVCQVCACTGPVGKWHPYWPVTWKSPGQEAHYATYLQLPLFPGTLASSRKCVRLTHALTCENAVDHRKF